MKLLFMHLSDLHLSKYDDINEDAIAGIAQTLSSQNIGSRAMMAITLLHHSHQWFHDSCKRDLERALLEKNTFVFCGHEHTPITQEITYNGVGPAHVFCGGGLPEVSRLIFSP